MNEFFGILKAGNFFSGWTTVSLIQEELSYMELNGWFVTENIAYVRFDNAD